MMRRIFCLLTVLTPVWLFANDVPLKRVLPKESDLKPDIAYFDLLVTGKKIGWLSFEITKRQYQGEEVFASESILFQKLLNGGEELASSSVDTEYFSTVPPHRFLGAKSISKQNGFESTIKIVSTDDAKEQFVAQISGGAAQREKVIGALDYQLGDLFASAHWCEEFPEIGAAIRVNELDFADLEVRPALNTVTKILPESGDGAVERCGRIGRYVIEYNDDVAKVRGLFVQDATGYLLRGDFPGGMTLELNTAEEAKKLEAAIDLFESSLVKIDRPLGDPTTIREMILEATGPGVESIPSSPNQLASYDKDSGILLLKVGQRHGVKSVVTAEDREKALEETTIYPTKDPAVVQLVEQAIGSATRPRARIKRLVDFVDQFIEDDYFNEPLSVNDIIETQLGDCSEHSQLFVTMARAAGIPAREVSGFIYGEDTEFSFGGHAWCEVEVDGYWHPVDPTWGEPKINATHIRISGERPSSDEMEVYRGGLKFRVLSVTDHRGKTRVLAEPTPK